jgi:hypothetical protein
MRVRAITLLSLLNANAEFGQPDLDRTTLVKQAFLVENLRPLYDIWIKTFSFVRYNYGPFSDEVFYQLDTLIFNGLVDVIKYQKSGGRIEAQYMITSSGAVKLKRFAPSEMIALTNDLVWSLQSIGVNQATKICKLVYEEPDFANVLEDDLQQGRGPQNRTPLLSVPIAENQSFQYLTTLAAVNSLTTNEDGRLSPRDLVRVYLELLASTISP